MFSPDFNVRVGQVGQASELTSEQSTSPAVYDSAVTFQAYRFATTSTFGFPLGSTTSGVVASGPNFQFLPASAVPEPASLTILGIGALGLFGYRLRRRRHATAPVA
jgi:cytochrome c biogenesis factor